MPKTPYHKVASIYIGIDPGKNGGMVSITRDGDISLVPMPDTEKDQLHELRRLFEFLGKATAVIEWIHPAIQGIGKSPMSKLYGNYMALRMALAALEIPYEIVMPRKWQQSLSISPRKKTENQREWKGRLKEKAQQLHPGVDVTLKTCDALLIATYCMRKETGRL